MAQAILVGDEDIHGNVFKRSLELQWTLQHGTRDRQKKVKCTMIVIVSLI